MHYDNFGTLMVATLASDLILDGMKAIASLWSWLKAVYGGAIYFPVASTLTNWEWFFCLERNVQPVAGGIGMLSWQWLSHSSADSLRRMPIGATFNTYSGIHSI